MIAGGHYGSGKTEFCLNLAIELRKECDKVAVIDLDIANPYFRSREKIDAFKALGIQIYGNFFSEEVTLEILRNKPDDEKSSAPPPRAERPAIIPSYSAIIIHSSSIPESYPAEREKTGAFSTNFKRTIPLSRGLVVK